MSGSLRSPTHHEALSRLAPAPEPAAIERLALYLDTVAEWNARVNLTGARTPGERAARLVEAVWPLVPLVPPGRLIDVGSGNGSPGLVLALVRNDLEVTLLEPRTRRWAFLREAARRCGRAVDVVRARHDGYRGVPARTVTVRALAVAPGELARLVEPGGTLVVIGSRPGNPAPFTPDVDASRTPDFWVLRRRQERAT